MTLPPLKIGLGRQATPPVQSTSPTKANSTNIIAQWAVKQFHEEQYRAMGETILGEEEDAVLEAEMQVEELNHEDGGTMKNIKEPSKQRILKDWQVLGEWRMEEIDTDDVQVEMADMANNKLDPFLSAN